MVRAHGLRYSNALTLSIFIFVFPVLDIFDYLKKNEMVEFTEEHSTATQTTARIRNIKMPFHVQEMQLLRLNSSKKFLEKYIAPSFFGVKRRAGCHFFFYPPTNYRSLISDYIFFFLYDIKRKTYFSTLLHHMRTKEWEWRWMGGAIPGKEKKKKLERPLAFSNKKTIKKRTKKNRVKNKIK